MTEASAGGGGGGGGGGHCEPLRYPQFAPVCHMLAASPTLALYIASFFLVSGCRDRVDDHQRNPNTNHRDHFVDN